MAILEADAATNKCVSVRQRVPPKLWSSTEPCLLKSLLLQSSHFLSLLSRNKFKNVLKDKSLYPPPSLLICLPLPPFTSLFFHDLLFPFPSPFLPLPSFSSLPFSFFPTPAIFFTPSLAVGIREQSSWTWVR